jgi:hypothetical protein
VQSGFILVLLEKMLDSTFGHWSQKVISMQFMSCRKVSSQSVTPKRGFDQILFSCYPVSVGCKCGHGFYMANIQCDEIWFGFQTLASVEGML